MKNFEDIDKNFKFKETFLKEGFVYKSVTDTPFKVYGLMRDNEKFIRLPKSVAESVNEGVAQLYMKTAGGRVRFRTNSQIIRISAKMNSILRNTSHFALSGSAGFDLYDDDKVQYKGTFSPPGTMTDGYEAEIREAHPDLPIIIITRPNPYPCEDELNRKEVIKTTYENAIKKGDKNIYYIDGQHFFDVFGGDSCTVDRTHPNDLGFMCMAKGIIAVMEEILKMQKRN